MLFWLIADICVILDSIKPKDNVGDYKNFDDMEFCNKSSSDSSLESEIVIETLFSDILDAFSSLWAILIWNYGWWTYYSWILIK